MGSSKEQDLKRAAMHNGERYQWFGWYYSPDLCRKKLCKLHFRGNLEFSRSVEGHGIGCGSDLEEGFQLWMSLREGDCRNFALSF